MQVVFSVTLSRLLPLHLGFDAFSTLAYAKLNSLRSKKATERATFINMSLNVRSWLR